MTRSTTTNVLSPLEAVDGAHQNAVQVIIAWSGFVCGLLQCDVVGDLLTIVPHCYELGQFVDNKGDVMDIELRLGSGHVHRLAVSHVDEKHR